jgi:hypothetical protein
MKFSVSGSSSGPQRPQFRNFMQYSSRSAGVTAGRFGNGVLRGAMLSRYITQDFGHMIRSARRDATMLPFKQFSHVSVTWESPSGSSGCGWPGAAASSKRMPLERRHPDALAGPVMPPSDDRRLDELRPGVCGVTLEIQ